MSSSPPVPATTCESCRGKGTRTSRLRRGRGRTITTTCVDCDGAGTIPAAPEPPTDGPSRIRCIACHGSGAGSSRSARNGGRCLCCSGIGTVLVNTDGVIVG